MNDRTGRLRSFILRHNPFSYVLQLSLPLPELDVLLHRDALEIVSCPR